MKLFDLEINETDNYLKVTDLENMLDVFTDKRGNIVFDLNRTIYINVDPNRLPEYECKAQLHWTTISYNIYGSTRLAWLLWKLNNIDASNIFQAKQPGDKVKYLPQKYVESIVSEINDFEQA